MEIHPLRAYRRERGLTQTQLAELLDVTKFTISRLETGGRPSLGLVERIVTRLGLPADDFFAPSRERTKWQEHLKRTGTGER